MGGGAGQEDQAPSCACVGRLWYLVWFSSCWQVWGAGQRGRELGWPVATPAPGANPGEEGSPDWWTDSEDPSSHGRKASWRRGKPGRP